MILSRVKVFIAKMIDGWVPADAVEKGKKVTSKRTKRATVTETTRPLTEPRVETQTQQKKVDEVELDKTRSWTRIEDTEGKSEGLLDTKEAPTLSCLVCRAAGERETATATGTLEHD